MLDQTCENCFAPLLREPGMTGNGRVLCVRCEPPNTGTAVPLNVIHASERRIPSVAGMEIVDADHLDSDEELDDVEVAPDNQVLTRLNEDRISHDTAHTDYSCVEERAV